MCDKTHRWREMSREDVFPKKVKIVYQCIDCPLTTSQTADKQK